MTLYYRDKNGDYMSVDHGTRDYYRQIGKPDLREARCTAIRGERLSVCSCGVSVRWLRSHARRVPKARVPRAWLAML